MSVTSGNTYNSNTDIPAQIDGATVYFEIEATDDSSDVTTTAEYNYTIDDNPPIIILNEDFSICPASSWTSFSVSGTEDWECETNYMQVNAYNSTGVCDDWLISPAIDLNSYNNEILSFNSWSKYSDTYYPPIEIKYSSDYAGSGDPSSAAWYTLSATWSAENSELWTESGEIDISSITGSQVYFAFHYTSSGNGSGTSAWWEIDDINISGIEATANNLPQISGISNIPLLPTEEEDVTITATITDSDGTIATAEIKWGTTAGNYPNTVSMTNSGDDYSGIITAQAGGTTVYYVIEATDDDTGSTRSDENNFSFSVVVNELPEITSISHLPASPLETEDVTVSATVTDSDGTIATAEIKWGTTTGNYPNTVSMTNSGDVYSGIIPSQTGGTAIYFVIEATDDDADSERSSEYSFSFNTTGNETPQITNININPTDPESTESVSVSATITDSDGTISNAEIKWGTSTGDYPNTITMTNSGDTYSGAIPSQADETQVYFIIYAVDEDGGSVQSSENDYVVNNPNIVPEITNIIYTPTDPESTENVNVSATITDSDGTIVSADIKWGISTGNYPNTINMTNSGDKYSGIIPSQADGIEVYFVISAVDNEGGSSQSSENDYLVDDPNVLPLITDVVYDPLDPESTENVNVTATITDSDGAISTAEIKWGTSTGSYPNTVSMTNVGNNYSGIIPSQADGIEVYFVISAIDNEGGSSQSSENDYLVDDPNVLPLITDVVYDPSDPESNENVRVSATITDSDGTINSANIKWGTSTGSYPSSVAMSNSGDDYIGEIPMQTDGTTVYFIVEAGDNESGISSSAEYNYTVTDPVNQAPVITEVVINPENPTNEDNVIISCSADDNDGSVETVVLKWKRGTGNYTDVNMNLSGGKYYGQIPKQPTGETIYFSIVAEDNEALQVTYEGSYEVSESINIYNLERNNINIYPNPTNDKITIKSSNAEYIESIVVFSLMGEKVLEINDLYSITYTVELRSFPKGIYIIKVGNGESSIIKRIILK
ncbi:choice-of-anchor J domain-containing protein [Bacteroidota bacterium]